MNKTYQLKDYQIENAKKALVFLAVISFALFASTAFGAGLADTASKADSAVKDVVKYGVMLAGSIGTGVLLLKFVQAWQGHLDWMDFLKFAFFYACAGGVVGIASYIFGVFK